MKVELKTLVWEEGRGERKLLTILNGYTFIIGIIGVYTLMRHDDYFVLIIWVLTITMLTLITKSYKKWEKKKEEQKKVKQKE